MENRHLFKDKEFLRKHILRLQDLNKPQDFQKLFIKPAPLVLDIGSGKGEFATTMATLFPNLNFLCIEKRPDRTLATAKRKLKNNLDNLFIFQGKIEHLIPHCFFKKSVHKAFMNFPDPWPKNAYRNRRNLNPEFLNEIYDLLETGGDFHFATDVKSYAEYAHSLLNQHPGFKNQNNSPWLTEVSSEYKTLFYHHAAKDGFSSHFLHFKSVETVANQSLANFW